MDVDILSMIKLFCPPVGISPHDMDNNKCMSNSHVTPHALVAAHFCEYQ